MREEEALEKWCPLARVSNWSSENPDSEGAINRNAHGAYEGTNCLGFKCMMWRVIDTHSGTFEYFCGIAGKVGVV